MKLLVSMDEHYACGEGDGFYSTAGTTSYAFWEPFLQVFSHVMILARVRNEPDPAKLKPAARANGEGVDFFPIPDFRGPLAYLRNRHQIVDLASRAAKGADACLLHGSGFISATLAGILYKKQLPFAVQVIGDPWEVLGKGGVGGPFREPFRWWATWKQRWICRTAVAAWYVTSKTLQRRYPANPSAYQTGFSDVQLGGALLDEEQLAERIRALQSLDARTPRLGFIGTLEQPYKGVEVLLRALALCAQRGVALTCDLAGSGKLHAEYEALASKLGLGATVRFLGKLPAGEAIFRFLDSVDLFVMPSLGGEGLPRAMVEAMARGCPVIGSSVGGIPELLSEDYRCPPGDHVQLAQVLESKLNSEELCRMARMNLEVANEYAPALLAQKRLKFLEEVLARSSHHRNQALAAADQNGHHES